MKKRITLLGCLKLAASLCTIFIILPVFACLLLVCQSPASRPLMLAALAACLLSCLIGIFCGAKLIPALSGRGGAVSALLGNLAVFLAALLCGASGFWAGRTLFPLPEAGASWSVWYIPALAAAACLVSGFLGCRVWESDYNDILGGRFLGALIILDLICSLLFWALKQELDLAVLSLTLLTAACVYAAAQNQGNIDYLMQKRSHNRSILPRRMRGYSFSLIAGISVLVFAGYFLRRPVAAFFRWILRLLRNAAAALLSLLPAGEGGESAMETAPSVSQGETGLPPAEGGSSVFWTIFGIVMVLLFLGLVFFYRREIWGAVCALFRKLRDLVSGVLFRQARNAGPADANEYFEDNVEELAREPGNFWKREKPYDLRRWKKEYKAFRGMAEGEDKLREGYRLAMQYLRLQKVPLSPPDTPAEILAKNGSVLPPELFARVTESYCLARYGGISPDGADSARMEEMLAACGRRD